ncbi:unnamed protein product [Oppiella nova]|uniref:Uncharacterized protein n=1 Tax=Oppiella nova TaxID=334625 RepID=A0A7R9LR06_9ACAR|nr:unnamed protein product [Oppiella nova]CAG2166122.1 unnamed protein product [Oppiella nova]
MSLDLVTELFGHNDRVWCVRWHPSGHTLASCGADKTIRLWAKSLFVPSVQSSIPSETPVEPAVEPSTPENTI